MMLLGHTTSALAVHVIDIHQVKYHTVYVEAAMILSAISGKLPDRTSIPPSNRKRTGQRMSRHIIDGFSHTK